MKTTNVLGRLTCQKLNTASGKNEEVGLINMHSFAREKYVVSKEGVMCI